MERTISFMNGEGSIGITQGVLLLKCGGQSDKG